MEHFVAYKIITYSGKLLSTARGMFKKLRGSVVRALYTLLGNT